MVILNPLLTSIAKRRRSVEWLHASFLEYWADDSGTIRDFTQAAATNIPIPMSIVVTAAT
jgi:hypothetical protein